MCNSYESRFVSARVESYKKVRKQKKKKIFLPPHVFWDPEWEKIRIRVNIPDPQHWLYTVLRTGEVAEFDSPFNTKKII
jgi:hypothetical protein